MSILKPTSLLPLLVCCSALAIILVTESKHLPAQQPCRNEDAVYQTGNAPFARSVVVWRPTAAHHLDSVVTVFSDRSILRIVDLIASGLLVCDKKLQSPRSSSSEILRKQVRPQPTFDERPIVDEIADQAKRVTVISIASSASAAICRQCHHAHHQIRAF